METMIQKITRNVLNITSFVLYVVTLIFWMEMGTLSDGLKILGIILHFPSALWFAARMLMTDKVSNYLKKFESK